MKYQLKYLIIIFISLGIIDASIAQIDENNSKPRNPNQMQLPSGDGTLDKQKSHLVTTRSTTINAKTSLTLNFPDDFRSIDGSNNNLVNTDWGQAEISFIRLANVNYLDGAYVMDNTLPSPRLISNICHSMPINTQIDTPNVSDMLWQWGQFLDHDITLSPEVTPAEDAEIHVPLGDAWFDPNSEGNKIISFGRSSYTTDTQSIRQQTNAITAYIDASNVYGSDTIRASALRTNDNSGKLKTSAGNLLPFNTDGIPNAPSADASFFLGGDFRANEQIGLTSMHIVFVREHNRLAEKISIEQPELSGEEIYQHARALVAAQMQVITYNEFLPLLLGNKIPDYSGYKPNINASISNEFATAAYRFGHTMLSPQILRLDENGNEAQHGHVALRDAFSSQVKLVNTVSKAC